MTSKPVFKFLFLFEPSTIKGFREGTLTPKFSHDLNLIQLAQAAISRNLEVFAADYQTPTKVFHLKKSLPSVELGQIMTNFKKEKAIVISANYLAFQRARSSRYRKRHKIIQVLVQAAIHPIEQPVLFYPFGSATYINVIRHSIDFIITQHHRMKELFLVMSKMLSGFNEEDRVILSKLAPSEPPANLSELRQKMRGELGLNEDDLVIINAGGAWKWTKFAEFLRAFQVANKLSDSKKLFFIQPALGQNDNLEHVAYHAEVVKILSEMPKEIRARIFLGDNWDINSNKFSEYLAAADYGLNLNLDSLENWQSYRVRTLEYLAFGLPVIMSKGTFWDEEGIENAMIFCGSTEKEIVDCLMHVETSHLNGELYIQRKLEIDAIRHSITLSTQAELAIESLLNHPKLGIDNQLISGSLWSYANSGAPRFSNLSGFGKQIYFWIVSKPMLHKLLSFIGIRAIWRKFKMRRELRLN